MFVVRAANVTTIAAKGGRVAQGAGGGPDLSRMNPALQRNGGTHGGAGATPPTRSFGRDRAIGQTVTIRKGPYKGLLGIVKDTTDLEARVELHTKGKTITVSKETLGFKDPLSGQPAAGRAGVNSRVPMINRSTGDRTPAWGLSSSRTPAWTGGAATSARTPSWRQDTTGSRTPAWNNDGRRTVNPYADGGRTVYGGAGGVSFSLSFSFPIPILTRNVTAHSRLGPRQPYLLRWHKLYSSLLLRQ